MGTPGAGREQTAVDGAASRPTGQERQPRKGNKRGAACAYNIKELRDRETELARHAEQAYERFVSQWQRRGNAKQRTGATKEERL